MKTAKLFDQKHQNIIFKYQRVIQKEKSVTI